MVLSEVEEEKIMDEYSRIAWKIIHRFVGGNKFTYDYLQDLHSECMVVLIAHLRAIDRKEDIRKIQVMDLVNVMTRFALKNQILTVGNDTKKFRKLIGIQPERASIADLSHSANVKTAKAKEYRINYNGAAVKESGSLDESVTTVVDYEEFCNGLTDREKYILERKENGDFDRQIAADLGITPRRVGAIANKLRDRYKKYVEVA